MPGGRLLSALRLDLGIGDGDGDAVEILPAALMTRAVPTMGAMATRTSCSWSAVKPVVRAGSIWAA